MKAFNTINNTNTLNLSTHALTTNDAKLLDLGLSFIPTCNRLSHSEILTSLNKLTRSIKLKAFFGDEDDDDNDQAPYEPNFERMFTKPNTWEPEDKDLSPSTEELISKLREATTTILKDYELKDNGYYYLRNTTHNLSHNQRQSMKTLRKNANIVIKPADKGGMVCILNKQSYLNEAFRQLNNTKYYTRIPEPLKQDLIPKINHILDRLYYKNFINMEQLTYLQADKDDKLRRFYLLPKIHKPIDKWPQKDMPEGRPIVSDCGTESRRISEYIDYFLAPLANKHPSYIKDTYDFIQKIRDKQIDPNYILVTGDITALYTNMDIDRTLRIVKEALSRHPQANRPDREILQLLELTMRNNDFTFCGLVFLQIFGTAMGKNFAPNCANLYLIEYDQRATHDFRIHPLFFFRFLDDTFLLWPGSVDDLKEYETFLNNLIPDIKITLNYSHTAVNFLDTTVFKHTHNGRTTLQTKVYFKDTDTHQLLHTSSFHPRPTFQGILTSQVLRFKRLCSFKQDYDTACLTLFNSLKIRGYNRRMLRKTKHDIWHNYQQKTNNANKTILPIVIKYSSLSTRLIREWKNLILSTEQFAEIRPISAYYRHKNLRNLLTTSRS